MTDLRPLANTGIAQESLVSDKDSEYEFSTENTGLTTALLLSQESRYDVTVAAKFMPGDYDIEYASPWAGANYFPVSQRDTAAAEWDRNTWPALYELAKNHPEAGVHFQGTD